MIKTGIESKVQIQDVISNQVPSFILDENPKFIDFLKQYYISQEYQGGPVDLSENLDQYLKLDNLRPEITGDYPILTSDIDENSSVITVSSTKGFPDKYGLLKVDDEIITYTGITTNSFIGCVRGFSGVTNYHQQLNKEELVFETSSAESHLSGKNVENLSSLFLREFFEKTKYTFAPGFEGKSFANDLNVGNFIKEINSFYLSKGTDDSIETLLKVLFGKSGKSINLEEYLLKSSDANFIRREVVIAQPITGNLSKLSGQTIVKKTDDQTRAVISEIEPFTRKGILYYKLNLYVGYDDKSAIEGTFEITPTTKSLDVISPGSSVISVDSTVGFDPSGVIYSGDNIITYEDKSFNQFLGCTGIGSTINKTDNIYSDTTYYGFEDGDANNPDKKCTFRITGVVSDIFPIDSNKVFVSEGQIIGIKYLGDLIKNPSKKSYKQIFANSWIYNTSTTVDIESISDVLILKTDVDKSQFKIGDRIEIIDKGSNNIVYPISNTDIPFISNILSDNDGLYRKLQIENFEYTPEPGRLYSIRRKINKAYSKNVPIKYGNQEIISDIQNLYTENGEDEYAYVASNGLPSSKFSDSTIYEFEDGSKPPLVIDIDQEIYKYQIDQNTVSPLQDVDAETEASTGIKEYTTINFGKEVKFLSGDRIYYETLFGSSPLVGLTTGSYYVDVLQGNKKIKLYTSRSHIASNLPSLKFRESDISGIGTHNFTLYEHRSNLIEPKKLFKKFKLNPNLKSGKREETIPGPTGMLINGVEIVNYKTEEKVYYGPLSSVSISNPGSGYDVINLPQISVPVSAGGINAKIQPVISGKLTDIIVDSNTTNFDIKEIISINVSGGNGSGGKFDPILTKKRIDLLFDARPVDQGGGISTVTPQISFLRNHNLFNGQKIIYRNETQYPNVGIDLDANGQNDATLIHNSSYYVRVDNNTTIKLFENIQDYQNNTNAISFGSTDKYGGIQKFVVGDEVNVLTEIKILDPGSFTNRKLIVNPIGINTFRDTIYFKNHNFENGDLIEYNFDTTPIGISGSVGLSTDVKYFVLKEDEDSFRICNAGIGGTVISNFENKKYVKFISSGVGYQYFKYPDITASINFVSVGNTSYQLDLIPVVKGSIIDAYLYDPGTNYGSEVLNFEKTPEIRVKEGKKGQVSPIIVSGLLIDVNIQFPGFDYFSPPNLTLFDPTGSGSGAKLRAITENGEITKVIIENSGRGYSSSSRIEITNSGSGVVFDSTVRSLSINNVNKIEKRQYQVFSVSDDQSSLNYGISGYYDELRNSFEDYGTSNSRIIGWAYDGNPIYGAYGQSDPNLVSSTTKRIESGYELDANNIANRPSIESFPLGFFIDDYVFKGSGDLDENNGRFVKTNEFPNGVYAYYATIEKNTDKPKYPYFIGNKYRTNTLKENINLNQNFDLNSSNLLRNTFPYKISELNADYDFVVESNEISKQRTKVESILSGSVNKISIIEPGQNYQVGDKLIFDNTKTNGGGIDAKVSLIEGKNITEISQNIVSYPQSVVTWESNSKVRVNTGIAHSLNSGDYVSISGISSVIPSPSILKLDGSYYKITVDDPVVLNLADEITAGVGITLVSVSNLSDKLRVGNTLTVGSDELFVLNIFPNQNILKCLRSSGTSSHDLGDPIVSKNYSFTINEDFDIFDSKQNHIYYFNPHESVGLGTTAGDSYETTFDFGSNTITRSIPMGSLYLENHKFKLNDRVTIFIPTSTSPFTVFDSTDPSNLSIETGDELYIKNVTPNTIGLSTTKEGTLLFFESNGSDNDFYYLQTNYTQEKADIDKITATVSVSTSHGLTNGDIVKLQVEPNLNVGIGTTTSISVIRNADLTIGINTVDSTIKSGPTSGSIDPWVFTTSPQKHNFKNGDKVIYSRTDGETVRYGDGVFNASNTTDPEMQNVAFYVRVLNDTDFTLSETYDDVFEPSILGSTTLSITGSTNYLSVLADPGHIWTLVNPQIEVTKGNNLVFDLTDTSLSGNVFKIYYDKEFNNEFISVGGTSVFNVSGVGTAGVSTDAKLTINYSDNLPETLYYNIESSSGSGINTSDTTVNNYNQISYINSVYTGSYSVSGIGSTTDVSFEISLRQESERVSYAKSESRKLEYNTLSSTAYGAVKEVDVISGGKNYKELPSILSIDSKIGKAFEGVCISEEIGRINEVEIINDGFEYSSDKSLTPRAFVSPSVTLRKSNILSNITVLNGGKNYVTKPTPVVVDYNSREAVLDGFLNVNLSGESILSIDVEVTPKGISSDNEIFVIDNSNGISILQVESNNSGIFTCVLNTPVVGFDEQSRFKIGDEVFIEGIQKDSSFGDGFNSSDLGYRFFKVTNYDASQSEDRVTIDASGYTSNTGIAKTIQDSSGTIINKKNYPSFTATTKPSVFFIGEELLVNNNEVDLKVESHTNETDLKVTGTYDLIVNDKLTGKNSGNVAYISSIEKTDAKYIVDYSLKKSFGWKSTVGRLNEDYQVLPDNDYYQTLSYSVRSPLTWEEIKSPINSLVHISGMKNFADSEIFSNTDYVTGIITSKTEVDIFVDLISEERVDKINNFDNSRDIDIIDGKSKFLEFENSVFIPYTKAKTNVVLKIDDISSEFSQFETEPLPYRNIFEIEKRRDYKNYTFKLTNEDNSQIQLTKLSIMSDPSGKSYIHEQESLVNVGIDTFHTEDELYGEFSLITTEFEETYLRFTPKDPYNTEYDVKYLTKRFGDSTVGIATTNIGFIDLVSSVTGVTTGANTGTLIDLDSSEHNSIVVDVHLNTLTTNKLNFVRLYANHDGNNTSISEYYYDGSVLNRSNEPIGIFTSILDSGRFKINYENTEEIETVILRARAICFGVDTNNTAIYRFLTTNQPAGYEKSVIYSSNHASGSSNSITPITILSLNKNLFDAVSSTIEVIISGNAGIGHTGTSIYDVSFIHDNINTYTQTGPALYAGSKDRAGMGTFGAELNGNNLDIKFYPDGTPGNGNVYINALSECFYTEIDNVNIPSDLQYGSLIESVGTFGYFALEGERINKKNFVLRHEKNPIFAKTFDPNNASQFNPETGVFSIPNHYFSNNEELIYTPRSSFEGVAAEAIEYSPGNYLPTTVYARVNDFEFDTFRISLNNNPNATDDYLSGFTDPGSGNIHQFAMKKSLSKAIISLDGMIQSPIAFTNITWQLEDNVGGLISTEATTFALSGIQTVNVSDVLKIDDEFMVVRSIGIGTTSIGPITGSGSTSIVVVERGILGTISTSHTDSTDVNVYKGSYDIVGDEIYFIDAPRGNASITRTESNLKFQTSDFSGRAFLRKDYSGNKIYDNVSNEFNGIGRTFTLSVEGVTDTGIGTTGGSGIVLINGIYQTPSAPNNPDNNFEIIEDQGPPGISSVVFSGYRDVGGQIGISRTDVNANQLPRGGIIVSLGSSGGLGYAPLVGAEIDLITDHHAPATWGQSNDGSIDLVVGKFISVVSAEGTLSNNNNTITGIDTSGIAIGMEVQNSDNVAYGQKVQSVGINNVVLDNNLIVGPESTTINFGYRRPLGGSGYFNNPTVTIVEDCLAVSGVGVTAVITATVGAGGSAIFNIDNGGSGHADYPQAFVSEPSYSNLEVTGISRIGYGETTDTGVGLLMNIEIGAASTTGIGSTTGQFKGFSISRPGFSFRKGDKFTPIGLVTALGYSSPIEQLQFEVLETFDDTFSAWQFGNLDFIDSIKPYQNGIRTRFPLFYQGELFSVQVAEESRMKVENALLIFINGVLQNPGENYFFSGGASFTLSEPAKVDDQIAVFFYRGTQGVDDEQINSVIPTVERGDSVQINKYLQFNAQDERRVFDYKESDVLETSPYSGSGLYPSDSTFRPISWIKQKRDLILGGDYIYKTRRSLLSQIYPTTNIIKDINVGDKTIYVENTDIFKFEIDNNSSTSVNDLSFIIVDDSHEFIPAEFNTVLNGDGTLTISITNQNDVVGYSPSSTINAIINEPPFATRSGWPEAVKEGQPINESQRYYSLPPQVSNNTATFTVNTDSNGSIISQSTTPGSGYTQVPSVILPTPPNIYEITPISQTISGFSGNVTSIIPWNPTVDVGRIVQYVANVSGSYFEQISISNPGLYEFDVTDSSGSGTTNAIIRLKSNDGILTEIEMIDRGNGYTSGDTLIFSDAKINSSLPNTNELRLTVFKTLEAPEVYAMELKLRDYSLDPALNFNGNTVDGSLAVGDYVSLFNTTKNYESHDVTEYSTLDLDITSKINEETPGTSKLSNLPVVSIAGTHADAIYKVESLTIDAQTGIVTSYVHMAGGNNLDGVGSFGGEFSWGKIELDPSSSGISSSYTVSGNTTSSELVGYPIIQRRSGGLRGIGALYAGPGIAITA